MRGILGVRLTNWTALVTNSYTMSRTVSGLAFAATCPGAPGESEFFGRELRKFCTQPTGFCFYAASAIDCHTDTSK